MGTSEYLDDCCRRRLIFVTGKGGVGKTALSWATALACQRRGKRVAVASWNPLGQSTGGLPSEVRWNVESVTLETVAAFREYILRTLYFERLFDAVFDNRVFRTFVLATPGLSDTVIAGKIWDRCERNLQDILIVDLPATGHAISFFKSAIGVREVFPVGIVRRETDKILGMFGSAQTRIDLVATPAELAITECIEMHTALDALYPQRTRFLFLNKMLPKFDLPQLKTLRGASEELVSRYETDLLEQSQAVALTSQLALDPVEIPRWPNSSFAPLVEAIADLLESA